MSWQFINRWYPGRIQRISLALVLCLGLFLRLYDLGRGAVWVDEALEYWTASAPTGQVISAVAENILDPPLYSLILHFWMSAGSSEGYLRLPSAIFSMITLIGVMAAAYLLGGVWPSLLAGLLMAIAPVDLRYAQEVSQYSLLLCLVIWSANCLIVIHKHDFKWNNYALWLLLVLAAGYTHYGALFPIVSMFGIAALYNGYTRSKKRLFAMLLTALLFSLGILPVMIYLLPSQLSWAPITHLEEFVLSSPAEESSNLFQMIGHTVSFLFTAWPFTSLPEWIPNHLVGLTIGASLLKRRNLSRPEQFWLAWLLLTITGYTLTVRLGQYPPGSRHSLFLLAMLVPFMAQIFWRLLLNPDERWLAGLLIGTYLTISIISIPNFTFRNLIHPQADWTWPETNYDLRPSINYWLKNRTRKEPMYVYYGGALTFRYYLQIFGKEEERPPYNWAKFKKYYRPRPPMQVVYGKWLRERPSEELSGDVLAALPPNSESFWIIFLSVYKNEHEQTMTGLLASYAVDLQVKTKGSTLYRMVRR
jgi:hypothetical protein